MVTRRGFTLVEILVVIAIIAILAAITFPVFARVKDSANKNNDMTSLNRIRTAMALYRVDQGAYPPQIMGYATMYLSGPNAGNVVPADQRNDFLTTKKTALVYTTVVPVYDRASTISVLNDLTAASPRPVVFPNQDPTAVGTTPIGSIPDTSGTRQVYGPGDGAVCYNLTLNSMIAGSHCSDAGSTKRQFYEVSGYDVAGVPTGSGGKRYELRYARFWTNNAIGFGTGCDSVSGNCGAGSATDDPRQLGYNDPPDDTIVTWNSYFRDYDAGGIPKVGKYDIVVTVGGAAKPYDSKAMYNYSWRQRRTP